MAAAAPCQAHAPPPAVRLLRALTGAARPRTRAPPAVGRRQSQQQGPRGKLDELTAPSADPSGPALRNNNSRGASAPPPRRPGSAAGAAGGEGRSRGRPPAHPGAPPTRLGIWEARRGGAGAGDGLEPPRFSRLPALGEEEKAFDAGLARPTTEKAFGNVGAPDTRWRWCLGKLNRAKV